MSQSGRCNRSRVHSAHSTEARQLSGHAIYRGEKAYHGLIIETIGCGGIDGVDGQ